MPRITITIEMDSSAFKDSYDETARNPEVARILGWFAQDIMTPRSLDLEAGQTYDLLDSNGKAVGKAEVSE